MLFDINGRQQTRIPHRQNYNRWRRRLSDADHEQIMETLFHVMNQAIESGEAQGENGIFNSSFIPGANWTGTPYQPIYEACGQDFEQAQLFYGLLVWEAVMLHDDDWIFIRQQNTPEHPLGLTYFLGRE
ncbi:hypothetical protein JXA32_07000 [Candidatus Sumerlaeota bacterium]|nr:hypothetical protein [Candidatus Sumerlaeota bacterium]